MTPLQSIQLKDNKIVIVDQKKESVTLIPGDNCYLTVGKRRMTGPVRITRHDDVTWHVKKQESPPFELTVSPDRLEVYLTVHDNCHEKWKGTLQPARDGWKVDCIPERDPSRPITAADVIARYREQKFQASIDHAAIEQALQEKAQTPVTIARGEAAIEGKDGWVETHFSLDEEVPFGQTGSKLNYREKRRIPIVRPGELMATIHPPISGKPGTDVRGGLIIPKPTRAVNCRLKKSVREADGKVYSNITGRPSLTPGANPILDVIPVYTIDGNVDLQTGHVRFEGDIVIHGNVMETMQVTAGQRIVIHGGVYGAEVRAGESIHVEQTIRKSKVYAGQHGMLVQQLRQPLTHLYGQITSADKSRQLLEDEAAKKQQAISKDEVIHHLLNHFYPDVLTLTESVLRIFEEFNGYLPEELIDLRDILNRLIDESKGRFQATTWLALLEELTLCVEEKLDNCAQPESLVTETSDISYLETSGDVVFKGKGSTQSDIVASERILFAKPNASCRGGTLNAGKQIVAERLGSLSGSKTRCRAGTSISARLIQHCDIQITGHTLYVEEEENIEYYRDEDQTLSRHLH